jgi:hypothetical protein
MPSKIAAREETRDGFAEDVKENRCRQRFSMRILANCLLFKALVRKALTEGHSRGVLRQLP